MKKKGKGQEVKKENRNIILILMDKLEKKLREKNPILMLKLASIFLSYFLIAPLILSKVRSGSWNRDLVLWSFGVMIVMLVLFVIAFLFSKFNVGTETNNSFVNGFWNNFKTLARYLVYIGVIIGAILLVRYALDMYEERRTNRQVVDEVSENLQEEDEVDEEPQRRKEVIAIPRREVKREVRGVVTWCIRKDVTKSLEDTLNLRDVSSNVIIQRNDRKIMRFVTTHVFGDDIEFFWDKSQEFGEWHQGDKLHGRWYLKPKKGGKSFVGELCTNTGALLPLKLKLF